MADVRPLRGIRYAPEAVPDLAEVVTPPFDVISEEAQERYYARHPLNIIRAELGKIAPEDTTLDNRYTRAARTLAEWRQKGVLRQDAQPAYYAYQQTFQHGGQSYTRTSLCARVRLEPWEKHVVLRHEFTRKKDKDDRLQLLRACSVNLSPIMSMYSDPQGRMRRLLGEYLEHPAVQLTDEAGEGHRLHPYVHNYLNLSGQHNLTPGRKRKTPPRPTETQRRQQEVLVDTVLEKVIDTRWRLLYDTRLRRQAALFQLVERQEEADLISAVAAALHPESGIEPKQQSFLRALIHRSLERGLIHIMADLLEKAPPKDVFPWSWE